MAPAVASAQSLLLRDVLRVDPRTRTVTPASLWIEDGRLREVGPPDLEVEGIETLDLDGAYVLPALIDLRVYGTVQRSPGHRDSLHSAEAARLVASAGVAAAVDVFATIPRDVPEAARWLAGGPVVTTPRGPGREFPGARVVDRPEAARALLRGLAGARFVQLPLDRSKPGSLRGELLATIVASAREHGITPVAQVSDWGDVGEALDAGVDWLVQIPAGPLPRPLLERIAAHERPVSWTPQIALGRGLAEWVSDPALRDHAALARVLPDTMRADYGRVRVPQTRIGEVGLRLQLAARAVVELDSVGVSLRAGSGAGAVGTALGFTLVRELQAWVEAGIDPWTALEAATTGAGEVVGHPVGFEAGAPADYVVLPRSPIDDLPGLHEVGQVVLDGRVHDPAALAAGVAHRITEDMPANPLPFDGKVPLIVIVVAGFTVLLLIRRAIKRAAARALAEDPTSSAAPPSD